MTEEVWGRKLSIRNLDLKSHDDASVKGYVVVSLGCHIVYHFNRDEEYARISVWSYREYLYAIPWFKTFPVGLVSICADYVESKPMDMPVIVGHVWDRVNKAIVCFTRAGEMIRINPLARSALIAEGAEPLPDTVCFCQDSHYNFIGCAQYSKKRVFMHWRRDGSYWVKLMYSEDAGQPLYIGTYERRKDQPLDTMATLYRNPETGIFDIEILVDDTPRKLVGVDGALALSSDRYEASFVPPAPFGRDATLFFSTLDHKRLLVSIRSCPTVFCLDISSHSSMTRALVPVLSFGVPLLGPASVTPNGHVTCIMDKGRIGSALLPTVSSGSVQPCRWSLVYDPKDDKEYI